MNVSHVGRKPVDRPLGVECPLCHERIAARAADPAEFNFQTIEPVYTAEHKCPRQEGIAHGRANVSRHR